MYTDDQRVVIPVVVLVTWLLRGLLLLFRPNRNMVDTQAVQQYLVSELSHRDKARQEQFAPRTRPLANAPRQHNSSDCGVLMLHVMEVRCDVAAQKYGCYNLQLRDVCFRICR